MYDIVFCATVKETGLERALRCEEASAGRLLWEPGSKVMGGLRVSYLSSLRSNPANEGQKRSLPFPQVSALYSFGRVGKSGKAEESCGLPPERKRRHTAQCTQPHRGAGPVVDQPACSVLTPGNRFPEHG